MIYFLQFNQILMSSCQKMHHDDLEYLNYLHMTKLNVLLKYLYEFIFFLFKKYI